MNGLIILGNKRDIKPEDLWSLEKQEVSEHLTKKIESHWLKAAKIYLDKQNNLANRLNGESVSAKYKITETNGEQVKLNSGENTKIVSSKIKQPSIVWCLFKAFHGQIIVSAILKLMRDILLFTGPVMLGWLIKYVKSKNESIVPGLFFMFFLTISYILQSVLFHQYFDRTFTSGARLRISLSNLIYKKVVSFSLYR